MTPCANFPDVFLAAAEHEQVAISRAKALCTSCPGRYACATAALERKEPAGIWGALTTEQREAITGPCFAPERKLMGKRDRIHVEDIEFMALNGETWEGCAARLGVKKNSIDTALRRHNRGDVIARLTRNSDRNESSVRPDLERAS